MGQVLHRGATTTEAVRRAIQQSQESLRTLARRHGINPKTAINAQPLEKVKLASSTILDRHRPLLA
jgi:hypothetical protein